MSLVRLSSYDDIPVVNFGDYENKKQYYSSHETFWRKKIEDPTQFPVDAPVFYYVFSKDYIDGFYIETLNENLTVKEALAIYHKDAAFFQYFETEEDMFIDVIESGSYVDQHMLAGWYYFDGEKQKKEKYVREHMAAFKIQYRFRECLLSPYHPFGVRKINHGYYWMISGNLLFNGKLLFKK